ncbi:MAG: MerR family transcriptional regulator [Nocardioidaceae bacterium]|nr:MerR family transcriptional regulator [Nocardioidaceae bacterium]
MTEHTGEHEHEPKDEDQDVSAGTSPSTTGSDAADDAMPTWGVGAVSARVGIATPTLRTWERRYSIGPSRRTGGGHRRYDEEDVSRVLLMGRLVTRGVPPQAASRVALSLDAAGLRAALAAPDRTDGAPVLVAPDVRPSVAVDTILAAATELDASTLSQVYARTIAEWGVVAAWTEVISPALALIGDAWFDGALGVDSEHLATERLAAQLHAVIGTRRPPSRGAPRVVLASADGDLHALPLLAVEAALAVEGTPCSSLGGRLPAGGLADLVRRLRPGVVFLWASMSRPPRDGVWRAFDDVTWPLTVLVGGPGWPTEVAERSHEHLTVERVDTLDDLLRGVREVGAG